MENKVDVVAKYIAKEILGICWEGLSKNGRIVDKGFDVFCFDYKNSRNFQGYQEDVRDMARKIIKLIEVDSCEKPS
jgi:hypothetical protein